MAFESLRPVAIETAAERIASQIRESILDGSLTPGTQLTEVQLAARLGVSRGPVREALQRLIQEGLLRAERNRGVFVMEMDLDDVHDVYLARRAIELEAVRRVLALGAHDLVAALEPIVDAMKEAEDADDTAGIVKADLAFHEALVDAAGSKRLSRMFRTLIGETRLSMAMGLSVPEWKRPAAQHRKLVTAIKRGVEADVLERLAAHLVHAPTAK